MAVNLSVKHVPASVAAALRRRAKQHHRSLQGELLAILSAATAAPADASSQHSATARDKTPATAWTPLTRGSIAPASEAALIIRAMRDGRTKTAAQLFDELAATGGQTPAESAAWIRRTRSSR